MPNTVPQGTSQGRRGQADMAGLCYLQNRQVVVHKQVVANKLNIGG